MVRFNQNVKVLGYYLSDEERALKRKWSQENYERMVEVKKQLRRNKLVQMSLKKDKKRVFTSASVTPQPQTDKVFYAHNGSSTSLDTAHIQAECERITSMIVSFVSISIGRLQQLSHSVEKEDAAPLLCLRNLVIPELIE